MPASTKADETVETPEAPEAIEGTARGLAAEGTVKSYVIASMGIGTLPLPVIDTAALLAVQMRMIQRISHLYGHTYSEKAVRSTILSLVGSSLSVGLGMGAASLLKMVPGVGWALGGLGMPVLCGASTYALGQVYVKHFEEGGSLLDLNVERVRNYYNEQFRKGKEVAANAEASAAA